MARIPVDPDETLRLIEQFDREPFRQALAEHLGCQPTATALQAFANKYPDRYWQATVMLTRMVGYSEAPQVSVSIQHRVQSMGQVELAKALREVLERINGLEQQQLPRNPLIPLAPIDCITVQAYGDTPPNDGTTEGGGGDPGAAAAASSPPAVVYPPPSPQEKI